VPRSHQRGFSWKALPASLREMPKRTGRGGRPNGTFLSPGSRHMAVPHFRSRSPQQDASGQRDEMQPREVGNFFAQPWKMRWLQRPTPPGNPRGEDGPLYGGGGSSFAATRPPPPCTGNGLLLDCMAGGNPSLSVFLAKVSASVETRGMAAGPPP